MVGSHIIVHVVEILGLFICAHHLWPKGVTYGEPEDWEKDHRKRQHRHSSSRSKSRNKRGSNSPVYEDAESPERPARGQRVRRRDRVDRGYEIEYQERPRRREIEYESEDRQRERPRVERRASERY